MLGSSARGSNTHRANVLPPVPCVCPKPAILQWPKDEGTEKMANLLLALSLHLSNTGSILEVAVLLQSLSSFLQLSAAVLQLLNVILLLNDGALVLMLLCLKVCQILLEPLHLYSRKMVSCCMSRIITSNSACRR